MSIIFDLFEPSRRHREEERNRLEWTRDEDGLGDPHRGPIDLDSGVVKVKAPGEDQDDAGPEHTLSEPNSAGEADRRAQNRDVTKPAAS